MVYVSDGLCLRWYIVSDDISLFNCSQLRLLNPRTAAGDGNYSTSEGRWDMTQDNRARHISVQELTSGCNVDQSSVLVDCPRMDVRVANNLASSVYAEPIIRVRQQVSVVVAQSTVDHRAELTCVLR